MDPALIYGPYGALVGSVFVIIWLDRKLTKSETEKEELRKASMDLLKRYQDRDEEERRWRVEQERRRGEAQR